MADETTMTDKARKIFYANRPRFDDKAAFQRDCTVEEQSIILGCYIDQKGIFVLRVDDPRLSGVMQVTSAHEMMHAAYDRLSSKEKKEVDQMVNAAYKDVTNQRIKDNVAAYEAKDPSIVTNELHSILASEVENLPPELENYYKKYFKDRSKVVAYSKNYEQAFVSLQNQVQDYDKQLATLKSKIESNEKQLDAIGAELSSQRKAIENQMSRGQADAINAQIDTFNARVSQYNALLNSTKESVSQYNEIVEKRNAAVTEEKDLIQKIDANYNSLNQAGQ